VATSTPITTALPMDLLLVLPGFVTKPFTHILPPLERAKVTTVDVITLDSLEIAKRARVPPADVRRLSSSIVEALHTDVGFDKPQTNIGASDGPSSSINPDVASRTISSTKRASQWNTISTLDPAMDALLGGGIPTGYVTEVTGERYAGQSDMWINVQWKREDPVPSKPLSSCPATKTTGATTACHIHIDRAPAIYSTTFTAPRMSSCSLNTSPEQAPSLEDILSINAMDLETQDHILNFHLPVAIERYDIGLVIIDSITSNYRAEYTSNSIQALAKRSSQLAKLGHLLRNLAVKEDIAIVLANQVSDRFESIKSNEPTPRTGFPLMSSQTADHGSGPASPFPKSRTEQLAIRNSQQPPSSSPAISSSPYHAPNDKNFDGSYLIAPRVRSMLNVAHQERFYSGWGDGAYPENGSPKNPALGFVWTTQIACRIALKKEESHSVGVSMGDNPYLASTQEAAQFQNGGNADAHRDPDSIAMPAPYLKNRVSDSQNQQPALGSESITRRTMKLVFAPWTAGPKDTPRKGQSGRRSGEVEFEIWKGGLRSTSHGE
ncbi:uncharacterized protein N7487_002315, partial [Penicillium crustosum]|uniref:uncharacterized protein n=1 Tax=Penicillium crustosum TaxID=36656 RepID=UPI00239247E2